MFSEQTTVLMQDEDCCGSTKRQMQTIRFSTSDGGGGKYVSISTSRWAINDRKEWVMLWDKYIAPMLVEDEVTT